MEEVNARLREKGMRKIDPADLQLAEGYGLTQEPAVEVEAVDEGAVGEEPPRG